MKRKTICERLRTVRRGKTDDYDLVYEPWNADDIMHDVILTNTDETKLYKVSARRDANLVTYAPFVRNHYSEVSSGALANDVFAALKGQGTHVHMSDEERAKLLRSGAERVRSLIGPTLGNNVTHVVVAPSSSALAHEFAQACMTALGISGHPLEKAKLVNDMHRKTDDLSKIFVSDKFIKYTYDNIMKKAQEKAEVENKPIDVTPEGAQARAMGNFDDAQKALDSAIRNVRTRQAAWDKNPQTRTGRRPSFTISNMPHRYRMWIEGYIERSPNTSELNDVGTVIIVDDNVDTGQTVFEIAKDLVNQGAKNIIGLALYKFTYVGKRVTEKEFWLRKVSDWSPQNVLLARKWLTAMKTGTRVVPAVERGFESKFASKIEPLILRLDDEIRKNRLKESIRQFVRLLV